LTVSTVWWSWRFVSAIVKTLRRVAYRLATVSHALMKEGRRRPVLVVAIVPRVAFLIITEDVAMKSRLLVA